MSWESYLATRALAFLLPASEVKGVSVEEATALLHRLTGSPKALRLLRLAALFAPATEDLRRLVALVSELAHNLPARTEVEPRTWEGGFHGRLDVRATQQLHAEGQRTSFVTRHPRRTFDFPETQFLRAVVERLIEAVRELREYEVMSERQPWGAGALDAASQLEHIVQSSRLRLVSLPSRTELAGGLAAARAARHRAYAAAAEWHQRMHDGLESKDERRIARVLARGSLWPVDVNVRFEIAVAIRLIEALHDRLAERVGAGAFVLRRSILKSGRDELATFEHGGRSLRVFYNQAWLPAGPWELGEQYYVGGGGRKRPDLTVVVDEGQQVIDACVVEIKNAAGRDYAATGFQEAVLYRWEYAPFLKGWPKAMLVTSFPLPQVEFRREDEVVGCDWDRWLPPSVADGLLASLLGHAF